MRLVWQWFLPGRGLLNIERVIYNGDFFMQDAVKKILKAIGEDITREGLKRTPQRVEESLKYLTHGYSIDIDAMLKDTIYNESNRDMVVIKDIELYSICEHHLLPFFGKCHVGYIPKGKVIGLSKIPRVVDAFARRLQLQERLVNQIAKKLWKHLEPSGLGVVIEANHLCMMMRGVQKQNSVMVTSCMLGLFRSRYETKTEFLSFIKNY